jgi:hypothetical protein
MSAPKMADVVYAQNFFGAQWGETDFARMTNAHGVSAKIG